MRRAEKVNWGWKACFAMLSVIMVLVLGLCVEQFSIVSYAQSQGKVTASSANIRKEPNSGSTVVGSATQNASVTINHQIADSNGTMWYQVFVNADTLGYIRSDLVSITDGTTPKTVTSSATTTPTTPTTQTPATTAPATNETPAEVTAVEPVSASVTGGRNVRVRGNASTTSNIVTTARDGLALTVTGQATGTDNKLWYQVTFVENGTEITGFIRSDYVALGGELVPVIENVEEPVVPQEPEEEPVVPQEPEEHKDWETKLQDDTWYLMDMVSGEQYNITSTIQAGKQNAEAYADSQKTVKSQKIAIILLVILLIAAGAAIAMLVFKIKDMLDSAYISEVEKNTLRRRNEERSRGGQRVMHTVGAEKKPINGAQSGRPQGSRPAGAPTQGGRPQGSKPAGAPSQGARPQGSRPVGAPSQGGRPQGGRPTGAPSQGARPQGSRPAGAPLQSGMPQGAVAQSEMPQGARPQEEKPVSTPRQVNKPQTAQGNVQKQNQGWQSKNFMTDDDEFEFEFLNWDGEEE